MAILRMKMRPSGVTRISAESSVTRPSAAGSSRLRDFRSEIFVERDGKFALDFLLGNHGVAEQAADHGAADYVVLREAVAAHGGDAALGDGRLIRGNFAAILRVGIRRRS